MTQWFIDRREYARALESFVEGVPTGSRALWLQGDAGIGKTTLWDQGRRLAEAAGFRVLSARAVRAEAALAFATLGDLLAPVLDEALAELPSVQRRALEVALLLREPEGQPPDTRILGLAVLSVVRHVTRAGPLLLALDDVQWIDISSAQVLTFMLRRLDEEPVGVLATLRGTTADQPSPLVPVMARTDLCVVEPLSLHDTHRLLRRDRVALGRHLHRGAGRGGRPRLTDIVRAGACPDPHVSRGPSRASCRRGSRR